jgi:cytidyltransferase-like protein
MVGGCYDLLHVGHLAYLERCRELGEVLVVSVSSDDRVKARKGNDRPIIPEADRVALLSALACVDFALVAPNPNISAEIPTVMVLKSLKPDIFATSDPRFDEYQASLDLASTRILHVPDTRRGKKARSCDCTTDIIDHIRRA